MSRTIPCVVPAGTVIEIGQTINERGLDRSLAYEDTVAFLR